ncbi:hypothetical protein BKA64DRAFT_244706 [Cadophora sp. MPI-SDFR-AT-0126]|nr:hypothetical protein BKA64DRAFT_244706 [Leotiomycetes sp. MPI-SDFR-AT-0126]
MLSYVTTSCSASKISSCKKYRADEMIDYTTTDVTQKLIENGLIYNLIIGNIGLTPSNLFTAAHKFLLSTSKFIQVGESTSLATLRIFISRILLPRILGGGSSKFKLFSTRNSRGDLGRIARWVLEGKVKVLVEQVFEYEDAPNAIELLKKGRSASKIIVHVTNK